MSNSTTYKNLRSPHQSKTLDLAKSTLILARSISQPESEDAGFSLIEMIAVVLMIGILAAIAAPSWTAFLTRQSLNKANDAVLSTIQDAQQKAKSFKQNYSVSFRTSNSVLQSAVYPTSLASGSIVWQNLGSTLNIPAGSILLGSNITSANTAGSTNTYNQVYNSTSQNQTITFNYQGVLANNASIGSGLEIVLAAPIGTSTSVSSIKRCVIINTLLGTAFTQKDASCGN